MMLLVFTLGGWKCALDISIVERTYRAAAVTPLPEAPSIVLGVVNIAGNVLPVIDLRSRFGLPPTILIPDNHFIIARTPRRQVALVVDTLAGVMECDEEAIVNADTILPELEQLQGVLGLPDGMILIQDLGKLLSLDEEAALEKALES